MTHILTNPGYPNNLRFRSKSAVVFREHERRKQGISKSDFDKIRSLSRQSWKHTWENPGEPLLSVKCNHFVTTYSSTHNYRALQEPTPCRPTSPTRRNNPHPTRFVFLLLVEVVLLIYQNVSAFNFLEISVEHSPSVFFTYVYFEEREVFWVIKTKQLVLKGGALLYHKVTVNSCSSSLLKGNCPVIFSPQIIFATSVEGG